MRGLQGPGGRVKDLARSGQPLGPSKRDCGRDDAHESARLSQPHRRPLLARGMRAGRARRRALSGLQASVRPSRLTASSSSHRARSPSSAAGGWPAPSSCSRPTATTTSGRSRRSTRRSAGTSRRCARSSETRSRRTSCRRRRSRAGVRYRSRVSCSADGGAQGIRRLRRVPRGRGRQARLRHPGRGDAGPQRVAGALLDRVRPGAPRAGRRLHGGRLRPPDRSRRRLPRNARPGRAEPGHRGRGRLPRPRAAGRAHRPGRPRAHAQGVAPVHRPGAGDAADHEVERAAGRRGDHPRGRPQGVQGRRGGEARRDAHRAARGRDGGGAATPSRCRAPPGAARAVRARAAARRRPDPRRAITPVALAGNGVVRARRGAGAARVRARDGHPGRRDVHGQGPAAARQPRALGAVGLQAGDYSMAGFEEADVVLAIGYDLVEHSPEHWNPRPRQEDHLHRLGPRGDRRVLHARGRAGRRHLPRAQPARRGVPPRAAPGRLDQAARRGARPLRAGQGRRRLPGAAAARAVRDPPGARPRGHPDLGRRPAQALDRPHVPGLRAEHRADRQRPRGHGLRGPGGDRARSSCTRSARSSRSTATAGS